MARFACACALIRCVSRNGNVAKFGKALCVKPRNLFFNAAVGVGNNNSGVFFCRVIACRGVNIGGNFQPVQLVAYGVETSIKSVLCGRWKLVTSASIILNL